MKTFDLIFYSIAAVAILLNVANIAIALRALFFRWPNRKERGGK